MQWVHSTSPGPITLLSVCPTLSRRSQVRTNPLIIMHLPFGSSIWRLQGCNTELAMAFRFARGPPKSVQFFFFFGATGLSSLNVHCLGVLSAAGSVVSVVAVCGALATLAAAAAIAHYFGLIRLLPAPPAPRLTEAQLLAMQPSSELSSAHGSPYPYHSSGAARTRAYVFHGAHYWANLLAPASILPASCATKCT